MNQEALEIAETLGSEHTKDYHDLIGIVTGLSALFQNRIVTVEKVLNAPGDIVITMRVSVK